MFRPQRAIHRVKWWRKICIVGLLGTFDDAVAIYNAWSAYKCIHSIIMLIFFSKHHRAQAEENCSEQCTSPSSCPTGQTCYMATNCYNPIISLKSNMLVTMQGPDRAMETSEGDVFGGTMNDIIGEQATALGVNMGGVEVGAQEILDRRTLYDRIGERYLSTRIYNITQRFLPSGSSALDVSMVVTGEYRPPPYLDLDVIAEDSINRAGTKVVSTLKERGSRAGMTFFDRVSGVEAVARVIVTQRPTKTPTAKPTRGPSRSPTSAPSMEPSSSPSGEL